jgi:hypothetical protein
MVGFVLAQDLSQMGLVPDEGAVQELAPASPDPAFHDRVHARSPDAAEHGGEPGPPPPIPPIKENLIQFDLNLPYSRTVETYVRSDMLKLDRRTRAAAVRRITELGRAQRLTGGYPEWKRAGLPTAAGEDG